MVTIVLISASYQNYKIMQDHSISWYLSEKAIPSVQVWNRHLPHIRTQCGLHPFKAEGSLQNSQYCSQCYCYICDAAASSCKAWGTGKPLIT